MANVWRLEKAKMQEMTPLWCIYTPGRPDSMVDKIPNTFHSEFSLNLTNILNSKKELFLKYILFKGYSTAFKYWERSYQLVTYTVYLFLIYSMILQNEYLYIYIYIFLLTVSTSPPHQVWRCICCCNPLQLRGVQL